MGIIRLPTVDMYFEKSDLSDYPLIRNSMSLRRFHKIEQYLHMNDDTLMPKEGSPDYDPFYKVRPILDLTKNFTKHFKLGKNLACDEAIAAYKGHNIMKQYSPLKPNKWGFKCWVIATSDHGYALECIMYSGKKESTNDEFLLGEQVILKLSEPFFNLNHCIFFDNFSPQ